MGMAIVGRVYFSSAMKHRSLAPSEIFGPLTSTQAVRQRSDLIVLNDALEVKQNKLTSSCMKMDGFFSNCQGQKSDVNISKKCQQLAN